ncbi:amino acid ABC transporter ATP-binding protein [Campylobacter lari]|uniref:amino acid ABC transporter ATP-binding protein n=1 Tax=Campylobacter lari TaxID=201 RepID=UPI0021F78092|nr:amino acid ABC transporter ATP-binding protein [Campylobacter lari]MCW0185967.1 amino acid ABC transporter ATP-binding protein [Campylobacter lari]
MIKIENLIKKYGDLEVLKDISIEVHKGDIIAIIGPSGGGKSTFLRCLNKLETPDSGNIYINNINILDKKTDINKIRQKVSMVFQHFNLFNNKNVLENLCLAPVQTKIMGKDEAVKKARELLKKVGLSDKENYFPHKLSGGQKQRIAIARSLMMNPDVILFDEPTSALDPEMIGEVLNIMKEVAKESLTMLVVTHEMGFARNVANRIFFMDKGIIAVDECPKIAFENPENERLKEFLNQVLNH